MNTKKGSVWHKWDLHVHTPASAIAHTLGDSWDIYTERLVEAAQKHQVLAFATADYFTIDGYRKLLSYYNSANGNLSVNGKVANVSIIPGIELRLNVFNSDNESINIHVFFDPEHCSPDFIESHFLEELKVSYRGAEYPLKMQSLLAIGKSITSGNAVVIGEDFSRASDDDKRSFKKKALAAITLSKRDINDALKEIDEVFERQKLPQKAYLVAIVGKGHGGISSLKWFEENKQFSRSGLVREDMTHQADIVFSNDPDDRKFYLGYNATTPTEEIVQRFSNLKPCVWGSDSHSLDKLLHPSNGGTFDYTWIKGDVTFEGFKQIVYEPELRVRVQQDDPSEEETYAKIEKLNVDFPKDLKIKDKESTEAIPFCIQGKQEISFSSNLTCIIGGRGSGKSTLVHILYNLVTGRDAERLAKVSSPLFNLQLGSKDELAKIRSLSKTDIPSNTEFFLQNEVERFAKDINEMSNLIRSRLYGLSTLEDAKQSLRQIEDQWGTTATDMKEVISAYDEITRIDLEIGSLKNQKDTLKKQTDVITSKEYKKLQKEIEQIASEISSFETYEREHKRLSVEISALIKSAKRLNWSKFEGQSVLDSLTSTLEKDNAELQKSFENAKKKHDDQNYKTKLGDKKAALKTFLKDKGLSPENIGEVAAATQQIADLDEKVKTLQQERVPYEEVYGRKAEILKPYKEAYDSFKERFGEVTGTLQSDLGVLKFDDEATNISFQLKTNDQLLRDEIVDFVKGNNTSKVTLRSDNIQSVLFGENAVPLADLVSDKQKIIEVVNNSQVADVHTQIIRELINDPLFVEKLHLRMQRNHYDIKNIQVQTKLGEKLLQNTSFGERCGIVIAIVLVAGTNPIIVDQPEDNLDGKYVSKVLVPLIRGQKQKRQIILVTRDANIAIGGDSELILILDKEATGTQFLPSTIENKENRPKYIWILDGGAKAFQTREEKYNLIRTRI